MMRTGLLVTVLLSAVLLAWSGEALSQNYPDRPVRIVAPEIGGGSDLAARVVAAELTQSMGQQFIVDNRGGMVNIPAGIVRQSLPDGYTLLFASGNLWLAPFLQAKAPFDPVKDFIPISMTNRAPNIVVVPLSLSASSIKEFVALAKARPGEMNFGTSGTGSSSHLAAELFKSMAGINIVRIPYKGLALANNDLMSGRLQLMIPNAAAAMPHVKAGRIKALAVTSAEPSPMAPGLPTVSASGVPGYESAAVNGIFAPAKTPDAILKKLNQQIVESLNKPEVKTRMFNSGFEVVASPPQVMAAFMKAEMDRMGKVIAAAGIRE